MFVYVLYGTSDALFREYVTNNYNINDVYTREYL